LVLLNLYFCAATPKIFGVGLSKTGTTSLGEALRLLNLNNLHNDRTFLPFLYENYDFNGRYDHLDAVEDLPTAAYYEQMLKAYPDAKFILTTRETDKWYESFKLHTERAIRRWGGFVPFRIQKLHELVYGSWEPSEELWKNHYEAHNRRVQQVIPADQLLVLNIVDNEEGWDTLCPFLGSKEGPCAKDSKVDFPHANTGVDNQANLREGTCVDKIPGSPARYAYVMLLGDVSLPGSRDYLVASLVLTQSIRNTGSQADVVALVFGTLSKPDQNLVESYGIKIVRVDTVGGPISNDPGPFGARTGAIYRAKIRTMGLTEYDRIIFIDLDAVLLSNADHLFKLENFTAIVGSNSPFNAGFFVLTPSCQSLVDVIDVAHSDTFSVEKGWFEYGMFPHWLPSHQGQMSDWSFYASQAEQGLMFYYYGCYQKKGDFLPVNSWDSVMVHFVGSHKPWLADPLYLGNVPKRYREGTLLWFQILQQVQKNVLQFTPDMAHLVKLSGARKEDYGMDPYTPPPPPPPHPPPPHPPPPPPHPPPPPPCLTCQVGDWGNWSACSEPCGSGIRLRYRAITRQPTCNNTCPPLSQNMTCNNFSCNSIRLINGTVKCFNLETSIYSNTTQKIPAWNYTGGCGTNHTFTINSTWDWDPICNARVKCYTTCNSNKTVCDTTYFTDLKAACVNNSAKGPPLVACFDVAVGMYNTIKGENATKAYFGDQTAFCNCTTSAAEINWEKAVHTRLHAVLANICDTASSVFGTSVEQCRSYFLPALIRSVQKEDGIKINPL
jgi:hypothetical protein